MIHEAEIRYRTPRDNYPKLEGGIPIYVIEQNTLDILEYAQFSMYEPMYYWNPAEFDKFTRGGEQLGRYFSVAQDRGQEMYIWVVL